MDAAFMEKLESFEKTLSQIEQDTDRLRSDTNDIKVVQASIRSELAKLTEEVGKLNRKVFGNGESLDHQLTELSEKVRVQEEFRQDIKRFGWAIIIGLVINAAIQILGLGA